MSQHYAFTHGPTAACIYNICIHYTDSGILNVSALPCLFYSNMRDFLSNGYDMQRVPVVKPIQNKSKKSVLRFIKLLNASCCANWTLKWNARHMSIKALKLIDNFSDSSTDMRPVAYITEHSDAVPNYHVRLLRLFYDWTFYRMRIWSSLIRGFGPMLAVYMPFRWNRISPFLMPSFSIEPPNWQSVVLESLCYEQ